MECMCVLYVVFAPYVWCMHLNGGTRVYLWSLEYDIWHLLSISILRLVPRSLIEPETHHFGYVGWPLSSWEHPVPNPPCWGYNYD